MTLPFSPSSILKAHFSKYAISDIMTHDCMTFSFVCGNTHCKTAGACVHMRKPNDKCHSHSPRTLSAYTFQVDRVSHWPRAHTGGLAGCPVSPRNLPIPACPALGLHVHYHICLAFYVTMCWYLKSTHFTNRAMPQLSRMMTGFPSVFRKLK